MFYDAAAIFVEDEVPHVCWALAVAEGFDSRDYSSSPAVQKFQHDFAALEAGSDILQSYDMLNAVNGEHEFRELSLMLLAFAAAMVEEE